jgi:hypothetical protein
MLPADRTLPESGAMPEGFYNFRTADRIIIQFDLPAGWSDAGLARKHFVARPQPGLLPLEKVKRSQRLGIHPRLDWWMRIKQPDEFKRKNARHEGVENACE